MKKSKLWREMILLVVAAIVVACPSNAVAQLTGETYQCWSFTEETGQYGISADLDTLNNPYAVPQGGPVAHIQNMSTTPVLWTNNYGDGAWFGDAFKIILDIPNQPEPNPYKTLTLSMRYMGEISFLGATGIHVDGSLGMFEAGAFSETIDGEWKEYTQEFTIRPNPQEEIVILGLQGFSAPAVIDDICIQTVCVPEPLTVSFLAIGAGILLRKKKS